MATIAQLICTARTSKGVQEGWCVYTERGDMIGFVPSDYQGSRKYLYMPDAEPSEGTVLTGLTGRKPLQLALEEIDETVASCLELPRIQVTNMTFRLAQKMGWAHPGIQGSTTSRVGAFVVCIRNHGLSTTARCRPPRLFGTANRQSLYRLQKPRSFWRRVSCVSCGVMRASSFRLARSWAASITGSCKRLRRIRYEDTCESNSKWMIVTTQQEPQ